MLYLRNLSLTKGQKYFPLYFFLEILEFKILHVGVGHILN